MTELKTIELTEDQVNQIIEMMESGDSLRMHVAIQFLRHLLAGGE